MFSQRDASSITRCQHYLNFLTVGGYMLYMTPEKKDSGCNDSHSAISGIEHHRLLSCRGKVWVPSCRACIMTVNISCSLCELR